MSGVTIVDVDTIVSDAKLSLRCAAVGLRAIQEVLSTVAVARIAYRRAQIDMGVDEVEQDLGINRDELIDQMDRHVTVLEDVVSKLYPPEVKP